MTNGRFSNAHDFLREVSDAPDQALIRKIRCTTDIRTYLVVTGRTRPLLLSIRNRLCGGFHHEKLLVVFASSFWLVTVLRPVHVCYAVVV